MNKNILVQHYKGMKNGQRRRMATFVGLKMGCNSKVGVDVGYSRCNLSKDKFDPEAGIAFAIKNMVLGIQAPKVKGYEEFYDKFLERCNKYFKTNSVKKETKKVKGTKRKKKEIKIVMV